MTIEECTPKELQRLEAVFTRDIYPVLTPLAVGAGQPFPYISGLSLSLGVLAVDPDTAEERFARVKVPEGLDRFVDAGKRLVPLESVIAHFLPSLFPGMEIAERVLFRVTRDADFEVSDDADDLLEAVESELRRRRFGDVDPGRGVGLGVGRDARAAARGPRRPRGPDLRDRGPARPRRPDAAHAPRPARPEGRAVGADHAAAPRPRQGRRRGSSTRSAAATSSSTSRTSRSGRASRRSPPRPRTTPT